MEPEEGNPGRIKSIVNPTDYSKVETKEGKAFYLANTLDDNDRRSYVSLLSEFSDVFAWSPSDLTGISPGLLLGKPGAGAWEPGSLGAGIFSYGKTCAQKCM